MNQDKALAALIELTNTNLGFIPASPSEFDELGAKIQDKVGKTLSLSSIKRLWGYVTYDGFPSSSTLNTLAKFNGFANWQQFMISNLKLDTDDSAFLTDTTLDTASIVPGTCISIKWSSGKGCRMECLGGRRFRVLESANIKLQPNDSFTLFTIAVGVPLYATDIMRGEERIPAYIGAKKGGVSVIVMEI